MQHPEYKKPLQFRNVHSFVPQTPNLEEIKRANMKIKCQKIQQHELTILTPRSTRNLHGEGEKKKSFRNLSLVLDCQQEDTLRHFDQKIPKSNELTQQPQHNQNKVTFNSGIGYEGKQNVVFGKGNLIMKKKPKQINTIEFKEVKSTKNRQLPDQKQKGEHINQRIPNKQNHQFSMQANRDIEAQNHEENRYRINILPYANDFESSTYQSHYKALTLTSFKETLNEFSTHLSNTEIQLGNELTQKQLFVQSSIQQINDQFERISLKLVEMRQNSVKQMTDYIGKMKIEHKSNLKQLHDMRKSITRYLADINLHYEDIVRELEFKCFEDIMTQYNSKLQYFEEEVKWILDKKDSQPTALVHNIKRLFKHFQKIQLRYESKSSDRDMESNFTKKLEPLVLGEQIGSRRVS